MIFVKRSKQADGPYKDAQGERWNLVICPNVRPVIGWTIFETIDGCETEWGLTYDPLPDPEPEN